MLSEMSMDRVASEPLKLLLVEDSDDDAALVLREVARSGIDFTPTRVDNEADLREALRESFDIVLSDYTLPTLDAPRALRIVRELRGDLPFIVVSGTIGEDAAVEVMRNGANDYLLKDKLARLGPAIVRELREARARAASRRAELARKQAEASFRLIIESSPDLVVVHRHGRVIYANPKMVERLGYPDQGSLIGIALDRLVVEDDGRARAAADSQPPPATLAVERPAPVAQHWRHKDGSALAVEVVRSAVMFEGEVAQLFMARDLTERNHIAAAMIEMDRMAAIGILAAGVGHEINNPLAYVLANLEFVTGEIEMLVSELPDEAAVRLQDRISDLAQALADTNHGAERVRAIVQDLRTFSRSDEETVNAADVRQIIDSSLRMAAVTLRNRATVSRTFDDVPQVFASESRLGQVFLNLVVNAAQALPEGTPQDHRIDISVSYEDPMVTVTIADTGSGIPEDVLPRIFDPFFTTKPVGQGTGLGLSICKRIVVQLGGDISVESQVGKGTTFTVRIPRARGPSLAAPRSIAPPPSSGRRGRILCVDDEPALGLALRRALVAEHDVVLTTSPNEALQQVRDGEVFDLLLCDLVMPGMSGVDFHDELESFAPELARRIVFLTGGALNARSREFFETAPNRRLDKPIGLDELRTTIATMLEP
ncbi:MAG: Sensory box histidine kinase/response regulator [Labilithrix sp.]|nr:Sensory box histidine kinase/response regulator [Labilithrix sp.]